LPTISPLPGDAHVITALARHHPTPRADVSTGGCGGA